VQISASEAFAKKRKNFTLFRSFREYFRRAERNYFRHAEKTPSVMPINHTRGSSGNHIQNIQIVRAHTRDFTMAAAGRAFSPDWAALGIIIIILILGVQQSGIS